MKLPMAEPDGSADARASHLACPGGTEGASPGRGGSTVRAPESRLNECRAGPPVSAVRAGPVSRVRSSDGGAAGRSHGTLACVVVWSEAGICDGPVAPGTGLAHAAVTRTASNPAQAARGTRAVARL